MVQSGNIDEMEQHLNVENNDNEADIYQEYFHHVMNHQGMPLPSLIEEAFNLKFKIWNLYVKYEMKALQFSLWNIHQFINN